MLKRSLYINAKNNQNFNIPIGIPSTDAINRVCTSLCIRNQPTTGISRCLL